MTRQRFLWAILAGLFVIAISDSAEAQRPAHYYPARPTFSPYLFYRQFNATGLPTYYTQIQPANRYYQDFISRSHVAPRIQARTPLLSEQVTEILENQLRQRPTTGVGQPAVPAQFMNTSHYFQSGRPRR